MLAAQNGASAKSKNSTQEKEGARKEDAGEQPVTRRGSSFLSWTFTRAVPVVVTGRSPATSHLHAVCFPAAPFRFSVL